MVCGTQRAEQLGPGRYSSEGFVEELWRKPGSNRGVCQSRGSRFPPENKVPTVETLSNDTLKLPTSLTFLYVSWYALSSIACPDSTVYK